MYALTPVLLFLCLSWSTSTPVAAQPMASPSPLGGPETVSLEVDGRPVPAVLHRSHLPESRGAVVVLTDARQGPTGPGPVPELSAGLAHHGWDVLALRPPPASAVDAPRGPEAALAGALARVDAAVQRVSALEPEGVFLAGHGWGAVVVAAAMAANQAPPMAGLVAIAMAASPGAAGPWSAERYFARIRRPVLDIYGTRDFQRVLQGAAARRAAARARGREAYTQVDIPGADHDFTGLEPVLTKRVRGWLAKQPVPPPELGAEPNPNL